MRILVLLLIATSAFAGDPEADLAYTHGARGAMEKLVSAGKPTPEQVVARQDWVLRHFPGTDIAAGIEMGRVGWVFAAKRYAEAIQAADAFVKKYPQYGGFEGDIAVTLTRIVRDESVAAPDRRAAFDSLLNHCRGSAVSLYQTQKYLAGIDLTDAEKYRLAKRGEEICGALPPAREFLWPFLARNAKLAKPEETIAECERFLKRYGEDSTESVAARTLLFQTRGQTNELAIFQVEEARIKAEAQTIVAACTELLKAGKVNEALEQAEGLRKLPRRVCESRIFAELLKKAANDSLDTQTKIVVLGFDRLPAGKLGDEMYKHVSESLVLSEDEACLALIRWIRDNASERQRETTRCNRVLRRFTESSARVQAFTMMAELSRTLGAADDESNALFEIGRALHDVDRAKALEALDQAARVCPGSFSAARSTWLRSYLTGELGLSQSPVPREPSRLVKDDAPAALALPAAPKAVDDVMRDGNVSRLRKLEPKQNLVVMSGAVSNSTSIIVPLKEPTSVDRLTVKTTVPCGVIVTLLDAAGKTRGKYERFWNFWEYYQTPALWPTEVVEFDLLPVAGVSFIRVDLYDPLGAAVSIREIAAYSSAYPVQALQVGAAQPLPANASALTVRWKAVEPERDVVHHASTESSRGFPIMRWRTPWKKFPRKAKLHAVGGALALEFYGSNATLELAGVGRVLPTLDGVKRDLIVHPTKDSSDHILAEKLPLGRHLLILANASAANDDDELGFAAGIEFGGLKVKGRSRVTPAIRFGNDKGEWGEWIVLENPTGSTVAVPQKSRPKRYQTALLFDTREVLGMDTATIENLSVEPAGNGEVKPGNSTKDLVAEVPVIVEELAEAARLITDQRMPVTFPKVGTIREYEAAKRLADRAGLYLVSDDIVLGGGPGIILSVGRPIVHRYARQLLASHQIWSSPAYLNNADGVVAIQLDSAGQPTGIYVTGETVEAIQRATDRLLKALPPLKKPAEPFQVFTSHSLEMIRAWQLFPEREVPKELTARLAVNDRRAVQFGIAANAKLDDLTVTCSALRSESGDELPATLVRHVGFFEWIPFFGDLRLPNQLIDKPVLPIPANSASGVWLTFESSKQTKPGMYRGEVTIASGGRRQVLPVRVTVETVALPDFTRAATYSFANIPRNWFHPGTPTYEKALRALARNEAIHGVSVVSPGIGMGTEYVRSNDWSFVTHFNSRQIEICEDEYRKAGKTLPSFLIYTPDLKLIDRDLFKEGGNHPPKTCRMFAEQLTEYLKKTGRADRLYVKVADEPGDIQQWTDLARPFRDGGLRTMTCHSGNYTNIAAAVGVMNPWCPNYQHNVTRPFFAERQKAGDAVWWYCCGVPVTRVTGSPIENLPFYWLTAKWNFDGAMNYAAMHMSEFYIPVPFRYDHGLEYRFMFQHDGSIIDTNRRELEQEGISDLKLIEFVRDHAKDDETKAALDKIIDAIVPYKYGYPYAPAAWHEARSAVYDLAVKVASGKER